MSKKAAAAKFEWKVSARDTRIEYRINGEGDIEVWAATCPYCANDSVVVREHVASGELWGYRHCEECAKLYRTGKLGDPLVSTRGGWDVAEEPKVEAKPKASKRKASTNGEVVTIDHEDLTVVPGIGRATQAKLVEGGITTLADLAVAEEVDGVKDEWAAYAAKLVMEAANGS